MKYIGSIENDTELIYGNEKILIYGAGKYGRRVYRNLMNNGRNKDVAAFIETVPESGGGVEIFGEDIPIIGLDEAQDLYGNAIVCVSGKYANEMEQLLAVHNIENIHHIDFIADCERWGTEYGGFYIPQSYNKEAPFIVYSFGIGEDLSFSQEAIRRGAEVYAFDPTPRAITYVNNHELSGHPRFHFYPVGLSAKDERTNFYLPVNTEYVSGSAVWHKTVDKNRMIEVEMKRLQTIMQELGHKKIDILKMDIEGSEFEVMNEVMETADEFVPFTMCCMETHERLFEGGAVLEQLHITMQKKGFYDRYGLLEEPAFIKC